MKLFRNKAQSMVEYSLLFAIVLVVIVLIMRHDGIVPSAARKALDTSFCGVESALTNMECRSLCGDGTCEELEDSYNCPEDCGTF